LEQKENFKILKNGIHLPVFEPPIFFFFKFFFINS